MPSLPIPGIRITSRQRTAPAWPSSSQGLSSAWARPVPPRLFHQAILPSLRPVKSELFSLTYEWHVTATPSAPAAFPRK
jgi:hypothetical protein